MKNIENFNVNELTRNELKSIGGGEFLRRVGRAFGKAWCAIKNYSPGENMNDVYIRNRMGGL